MTSPEAVGSFELRTRSLPPLSVLSMRGRESLSGLFAFDVVIATESHEDIRALVGTAAALSFRAARGGSEPERVVHGVVSSARLDSGVARGARRSWAVRLSPHLWLCRRRTTSRIYQDMTVPDIACEVLKSAGVACIPRLVATYAPRAYCVQYQESDYAFIRRILAEEGIAWSFEHPTSLDKTDRVVLLDAAATYPLLEPATLRLRAWQGGDQQRGGTDDVLSFSLSTGVVSTSVLLRDYDFKKPLLDLHASTSRGDSAGSSALLVYDHRGEYEQPDLDTKRAQVHLEQHRRRHVMGRGASTCPYLTAGARFRLEVDGAEGAGEYAAVEVTHVFEAEADGSPARYENAFECVPADVIFRPKRRRKRVAQVLESAVVTGPAGEEIYTDAHGRVKVKFHWDLGGSSNEHSSTWLRVISPWAGQGFGAQFLPRVGTEVMVSFLGGDPDCPVVAGSVYNATHPHPFTVPEHSTKSGFRTSSTPGGGGSNELSFDDKAGEEKVYVHAQRDLETVVVRDEETTVGRHEQRTVKGRAIHVFEGDRSERIGGGRDLIVGGSTSSRVAGSSSEAIDGMVSLEATSGRTARIGVLDALEVEGPRTETVAGDVTIRAGGSVTTVVGTADDPRAWLARAEGTATLSAGELLTLASDSGLTLQCGKSVLEISSDRIGLAANTIDISTPKARIQVDGDVIRIKADDTVQIVCDQVLAKTSDTSLALKTEVQVDGTQILLNSPAQAKDPVTDTPAPPTLIDLVDDTGEPIANQRYVLVMQDGSQRSGFLDENGHAEIAIDGDATITFPGCLEEARA